MRRRMEVLDAGGGIITGDGPGAGITRFDVLNLTLRELIDDPLLGNVEPQLSRENELSYTSKWQTGNENSFRVSRLRSYD